MKRHNKHDFNIDADALETILDLRIEVKGYIPPVDALPCSNPDSPLFSDPGSDAEIEEINLFLKVENLEIDLEKEAPELYQKVLDKIEDKIYDYCYRKLEEKFYE